MNNIKYQVKPLYIQPYELKHATPGSAGVDLQADIINDISLFPLERVLINTGVVLQIPEGYEATVRPRSGLASKYGLTVLNSPGTIDSDYRGVVRVLLINHGDKYVCIKPGDKIAQLVFTKYEKLTFQSAGVLEETIRGTGGFGSTDMKEEFSTKELAMHARLVATLAADMIHELDSEGDLPSVMRYIENMYNSIEAHQKVLGRLIQKYNFER